MTTPHFLAPPAPVETLSDIDITMAIERLFATQKGLNEHALAVANRVAQPGEVGAAEAAASQPGSPDPDHALASRIRQRHFWSAGLHDQDIEVQVSHGRATLIGTVDTWPERRQAATDAYEAGARDVNNHLRVLTHAPLPSEANELLLA